MNNWIEEMAELKPVARYSQFGEETYIDHVFSRIGTTNKFFVDLGAGGYGGGISNTKHLEIEQGWQGIKVDMDGSDGINVIREFITPFNIVSILQGASCPKAFDFLSIDLDSFDYDIMDSLLKEFSPSVICSEFNSSLPVMSSVKLKYEHGYTWDNTNKFGYSFMAGKNLFERHGYKLVFNQQGLNLYAVRADLINVEVPEIKAVQKNDHPINNDAIWVEA